jgi:hypothetical protein
LIEQDNGVDLLNHFVQAAGQLGFDFGRRRRPVLGIEAIQFARGSISLDAQRLAVDGCPAEGGGQKMFEVNPREAYERAAELVAFAVVAAEADGVNLADTECNQVVEDRARGARLTADFDDVVNG